MVLKLYQGAVLHVSSCLLIASLCTIVNAQSGPANRQIQLDQQRNEELQRELEQQRRDRTPLPQDTMAPAPEIDEAGPCFTVEDIILDGAIQLHSRDLEAITRPLIGNCMGRGDLNGLMNTITRWYVEAGYITTRAYLPQQSLAGGVLRLIVIEGVLESLQIDDASAASLNTAFPGLAGEVLNLRDIEQGLDQINRLASRSATMALQPGSEPGASVLALSVETRRPFSVRAGFNNSGQESTGELQRSLFASWDSPLGLNDYAYLSLQTDTEHSREGKKSESLSLYWDMPYGYWLLSLDASQFRYASLIEGSYSDFESSGDSDTQRVSLARTVHRDSHSKTKLGLSVSRKHTDNYLDDTRVDSSSRTLAISDWSINREQYFADGGVLAAGLHYYRGLPWFDSPRDDASPRDSPRAQFDKFGLNLDYQRGFAWRERPLQWQSRLVVQYSDDLLFGSEQISIGSQYTVRGYKGASISSHTGAYWRNALSTTVHTQTIVPWLSAIRGSLFYDAGVIRDDFFGDDKYARLQGWGVSLNLSNPWLVLDASYARPIDRPDYLPVAQDQFYLSLNLTY